jgi:hypothetical protein
MRGGVRRAEIETKVAIIRDGIVRISPDSPCRDYQEMIRTIGSGG